MTDEDTSTTDSTVDSTTEPAAGTTEAKGTDDTTGNAEAAGYRRRLREVEAERDGLNERLTTLGGQLTGAQRAEVERLAGVQLSRASDVWLDGIEVGALVDDDGRVDPARVTEAVAAVLDGRPQLAIPVSRVRPDPSQGNSGSGIEPASLADLIKSARKR